MRMLKLLTVGAVSLVTTACATIVGNPTQLLPIKSTPSDALIEITDEKGSQIFKGATPTTVTLPKGDGSYFGKKSYVVKVSKEGYEPQTIPVMGSPNGWYIAGNFLFGGLIGWLIVDPLNGHMYTLSPDQVDSTLGTKAAHNNAADRSIAIVLIEQVPAELREKMARLD